MLFNGIYIVMYITNSLIFSSYIISLSDNDFWLGLTDKATEGVWKWSDTNTVADFTDWYPGEPNSAWDTINEDCAVMYNVQHKFGYRWGDINCWRLFQPACERRNVTQ